MPIKDTIRDLAADYGLQVNEAGTDQEEAKKAKLDLFNQLRGMMQ